MEEDTLAPDPVDALRLPALSASVRRARHAVVDRCRAEGLSVVEDVAALLTSEVVTNAVLHGDGEVELRVSRDGEGLLVEVSDGSDTPVRRRAAGPDDEGGRGILLLEAMATRWGTRTLPGGGKVVWFWLSPTAGRAPA